MNTDKSLVKNVHTEEYNGFQIIGMLTRFGSFCVFVNWMDEDNYKFGIWQGENILKARHWIDTTGVNWIAP